MKAKALNIPNTLKIPKYNKVSQAFENEDTFKSPMSTGVFFKRAQVKSKVTTKIESCLEQIESIKYQFQQNFCEFSPQYEEKQSSKEIISLLTNIQRMLSQGSSIQITQDLNKQDKKFIFQNFVSQEQALNEKENEVSYQKKQREQDQQTTEQIEKLKLEHQQINRCCQIRSFQSILTFIGID